MNNRIDSPGDFYVLTPVIFNGRVMGCFGRPIISMVLNEKHEVTHYITAAATYPHGTAVWTCDGTVEMPGREWEDLESYEAHLKHTLLQ